MQSSPAQAAEYIVSSESDLAAAIVAANADGDATSTIRLAGDVTLADPSSLPALSKPLTIDTNGFVLSAVDGNNPGTSIALATPLPGGSLTIVGGGGVEGGDSSAAGGVGLALDGIVITNNGSITGGLRGNGVSNPVYGGVGAGQGLILTNGTLINNGTITGGSGIPGTGAPGYGALLEGGTGHVNNGIIQGGLSGRDNTAQPGLGMSNTDLLNNGIIRGSGAAGANGDGIYMTRTSTLTNSASGEIYGAEGTAVYRGGDGISIMDTANITIVNKGSIRGATTSLATAQGTIGIIAQAGNSGGFPPVPTANGTVTIINSGTIAGGNQGKDSDLTAILMQGAYKFTLELNAGSVIDGVVITHASRADDILRLGGGADEAFDVSLIGATEQYRGFDIFEKAGASTWTITGQGTNQAAPWDVYEGTMLMSAGSDLGNGLVNVFGGTLAGIGIVGPTTNHSGGTIAPGIDGIGVLTIDGDYTSGGGALKIDATLGNDGSPADLLLITGNSLLGLAPTLVSVTNLGGLGDETVEGIKIVDVEGPISDAGVFVLNGPAIGGAYVYELFQNGPVADPLTDGDWFLRNTGVLAPTVPTFENYPVALLGMIDLPTLRQRVGDRDDAAAGIWTRIEGAAGHYEASASSTGASYDSARFQAQAGLEGVLVADTDGSLTGGLTAQYGRHSADVVSSFGDGTNFTESYGLGATLTWRGTDGTYVDLQGQLASFSTDLDAIGYSLVEDNAGTGFAVSAEIGHKVVLDDAWAITPQAQLSYAAVDFDSFVDPFGSEISLANADSLVCRLGLAVDYQTDWQDSEGRAASSKLYGIANLTYEFLDGATVQVSGTDLAYSGQKFGGELGIGGTLEWDDGAQSIHGELLGSSSFEGSYAVKGTFGFTGRF